MTLHVHTIDHPLAQQALGQIRDQATPSPIFRAAVATLTRQLVYAATADLTTEPSPIRTPFADAEAHKITDLVAPIAILRSGAAMLETAIDTLPDCQAGHFGVYHDKRVGATVEYYLKLPEAVAESRVLLLDPAIGTGKTAIATIARLHEFGVTDICFLTLIASTGGLELIGENASDVRVYAIATADDVGPNGYLRPGMGDFGDRYYGSK
ncbi:MAG: uracil phosphoribosyltransferase [Verrucomicrobiales bacterium]|jgi:uracil phosphoribosyltransferase